MIIVFEFTPKLPVSGGAAYKKHRNKIIGMHSNILVGRKN